MIPKSNQSSYFESMETNQSRVTPNFLTGGLTNNVQNGAATQNPSIYYTTLNGDGKPNSNLRRSNSITVINNTVPTKSLKDSRPYMKNMSGRSLLIENNNIQKTHPYAFTNTTLSRYNNKENETDFENWITVFGYDMSNTQEILSIFTNFGKVTDKKISNRANYMHIRFDDKMHAYSARNKNGTLYSSTSMIGVKPCTDLSLIDDNPTKSNSSFTPYSDLNAAKSDNKSMLNYSFKNLVKPIDNAPKEPKKIVRQKSVIGRLYSYVTGNDKE